MTKPGATQPAKQRVSAARARPTQPARYVVVMAGGQGTRFWPRSRRRLPKQLLRVTGKHTLLQQTVRRLRPMFAWSRIIVVTNQSQAAEVRRQLPHLGAQQILAEPEGRNTLPCIALAAAWIEARAPQATMVVVAADHVIRDAAAFQRDLHRACAVGESQDALVTFGIRPTRPDTGYGYIETGRAIAGTQARWVKSFREKPAAALARRYLERGGYLWNSGMFVWRIAVLARALDEHVPAVRKSLSGVFDGIMAARMGSLRRIYRGLPSVPIDVAVMEPAAGRNSGPRVAVIEATFDWSDIGSWETIPDVLSTDANGNASAGALVAIDSGDSIIFSPERLVALLGVRDLIVVDSEDAILVCARGRAQQVRRVTEQLKQRGLTRYV
ncbi:MAG: mannose-1-phosphate guanylyltransferase [Deltaproteobacteria bacterium]|nr:mannose-1-phosphate guanylyltransferase [Deltaproteobacteria bacterium]